MKYIIMCGGTYPHWEEPRHFSLVHGERVLDRTIRLLKENGVEDIYVSATDHRFDEYNPLKHENTFVAYKTTNWVDAFYPMDEPVCYIMGDVVFSPDAIKTIVNTQTTDVEFFASAPPYSKQYSKPWAEPFAFKVVNTKHFKESIEEVKRYKNWNRTPIAWELWQVIKNTPRNKINYNNYTSIHDYTCDIDEPGDVAFYNSIDLD